ncbi:MAG: succinylglutamate desuccinylase/aspartoacylase family protein [Proteobacteria bacterium]|nr:succinylglutamate desuccinylase/aspartoacylase family protein [Pseudomonadota bacterium]
MEQSIESQDNKFHYWKDPAPDKIGPTVTEFLKRLPGPTHIHVTGTDSSRCRAVATLLHGNEPSGLYAVYETLQQQIRPAVDIHYFIPSVDAARQAPGFIYRMLPHQKDLNRCFKTPFGNSEQDLLAEDLLENLRRLNPECVIDIHNTSGSSPSFGVTTFMDERHDALVSLFTHRMIVTDLILGSLMEISDSMMPTVTIECGGAEDTESNRMATEGLIKYITYEDVLSVKHTDMSLEFFHNPLRVELLDGSDIAYGDHSLMKDGVTLLSDIEHFNFGYVGPENCLGFVSGELAANLTVLDIHRKERLLDYFTLEDGKLYPTRRLKLFMVTTNPEIARKDCLFYLVEGD